MNVRGTDIVVNAEKNINLGKPHTWTVDKQ